MSEIDLNVDFMQKGLRKLNYKVGRHEAKRIWLLSPSGKNRKPSSWWFILKSTALVQLWLVTCNMSFLTSLWILTETKFQKFFNFFLLGSSATNTTTTSTVTASTTTSSTGKPPRPKWLHCNNCKLPFGNAWDLMVHVQTAHMMNIYQLADTTKLQNVTTILISNWMIIRITQNTILWHFSILCKTVGDFDYGFTLHHFDTFAIHIWN